MQRIYQKWRAEALSMTGPLTQEQRITLKSALTSGHPVMINHTLLKVDMSNAFRTDSNPDGLFVHAQNHEGFVCAAANTTCQDGLDAALVWAEQQQVSPDGPA